MSPLGWLFAGYVAKDILSKDCEKEEKKEPKREMTHEEIWVNSSPLNVVRKDREK